MPADPQASGTWYQEQLGARLFVNTAREFELHYSDGTELVFKKITSPDQTTYRPYVMTDAVGNTTSLTWNDDDQLEKVVDSAGHTISFSYNAQGKITQVQEGSRQANLMYYQAGDALGTGNDLKRITITHGNETKTTEFTYSVGQSQEHLNHNMLTVVDSKGQTYVSNTYDSNDAVTQQIYGGDSYQYTYTRDSQ